MIIFTSSKGQDFSPIKPPLPPTAPDFQQKAEKLTALLRNLDLGGLQQLMGISESLARQTQAQILGVAQAERKAALLAYSGEAFRSLDAGGFSTEDSQYAQAHFRVLSGLYGVLRPFDLIAPHRLEMGYKLSNPTGKNLYSFWQAEVTAHLNAAMEQNSCKWLINLASLEYSKVVEQKQLCRPLLDIQFKEENGSKLKSVAIYVKRARGMMANFLIKNRVSTRTDITHFSEGGYLFRPELSKERLLVFTRPQT
ncbi:MAG: YaaA family protein [Desulfobulbus sp.]|nr:YaaA family protein [Desulfobulbus sp.]